MSNVIRLCPCDDDELLKLADALIDLQSKFEQDDCGTEGAVQCFVETCRVKKYLRQHCRLSDLEIDQMVYERREARGIPQP